MKKAILIIGVAAAVILCILAAGCTGTTSTTTPSESDYRGMWEQNTDTISNHLILTSSGTCTLSTVNIDTGKQTRLELYSWEYGISPAGDSYVTLSDNNTGEMCFVGMIFNEDKNKMYLAVDMYESSKYVTFNKVSDFTYKADVSTYDSTTTTTSKTTTTTTTKSTATLGEQNALKSAQSYLRSSSFSYNGLIEQLEYEGYSHAEAKYAVDNCGADWMKEAEETAKSYMRSSSFSKKELIEQLEYEGFTHAQAVHGAASVGYT